MDTKEVEAGKKYVFELLAVAGGDKFAVFETPTGCPVIVPQEEAEALYPVKGSLGTTPAPKYDPCRKFREGDVVDVILDGRGRTAFLYLEGYETPGDGHWVVTANEDASGRVNICYNGERCARVWYNMLELVTPVEAVGPFHVCQDAEMECFEVYKHEYTEDEEDGEKVWKIVRTTYFYGDNQGLRTLAEAKEAAEAERDRLNAEYRKEQNND